MKFILLYILCFYLPAGADTIKILSGESLPPYVFSDSDKGLDNQIVKQAFLAENINVSFVKVPFIRVRLNYKDSEIQCSSSVDKEANLNGSYSKPYITYIDMVYRLKGANVPNILTPSDFGNSSVLAFQDAHIYLGKDFKKMTKENKNYREINSQKEQLTLFFDKKYDYIVGDFFIINYWFNEINKHNKKQNMLFSNIADKFDIFKRIRYRVVCKDQKYTDLFNKGLDKIIKNGLREKIYKDLNIEYIDLKNKD